MDPPRTTLAEELEEPEMVATDYQATLATRD